jgi:hypothetical protein
MLPCEGSTVKKLFRYKYWSHFHDQTVLIKYWWNTMPYKSVVTKLRGVTSKKIVNFLNPL